MFQDEGQEGKPVHILIARCKEYKVEAKKQR